MSDRQQARVTRMESEMWNATVGHRVKLDKLQGMVDAICEYWRVEPAKVRPLPRKLRNRIADCGGGIIRLGYRGGGRTGWTAVHEACHHVCDEKYELLGGEIEAHGPEWATVFAITLDAFFIMPLAASLPMFKAYRIEVNDDTIKAYKRTGKRASKRLRKNPIRKARQASRPVVGSVLAQGRLRGVRRRTDSVVLVWLH